MNNNLSIAYILSDFNYYMVLVSMYSVLKNNPNSDINFYLIVDEFYTLKNNFFIKEFRRYENCTIKIIKESSSKYELVKQKTWFTKEFYIFNLANLIDEKRVLFLYENSLVNSDLSEVFNVDLKNDSCGAIEFLYGQDFDKFNFKKEIYFFPCTLLIDLGKWRSENVFQKMVSGKYLEFSHYQALTWLNCFNIVINNCKLFDFTYGYTESNLGWFGNIPVKCSKKTQEEYEAINKRFLDGKIIHFVGQSPLTGKICENTYTSLWWEYCKQTSVYEKVKEFRRLNKYKLSATAASNSFKYTWLLSRIWPYIKPYWFRILIGFLIAIPLGLLDGVTAIALKPYMDYVIGAKEFVFAWHGINLSISSMQMAFILPAGVILFAALQGVLRYLNGYFSTWTSQRITNDVKFNLFDRLIHMHPQFFDDNSSGIVISRYMGDPGTASAGIVDNIKTITTSLCGALGLVAVMFYSSWKLAFIGVLVLCIAFIPVVLIRRRIKEASNKNMVIGGNITTNINETYSGNKVMAAYGLQDRQNKYFKEQTWKSFNINMSLYKRAGWMSPLMYLIASFGIATVLGVGTYLINSNQMTAGAFASFVTSLLLLYKPVKTLGNTLTGIQNIFVAMGRVFELFDLEPEIKDPENPLELKGLKEGIEFNNVNFEYVPNVPVLKDFSLYVKKNETIAIVGNSGGGKSTLVNLIPRFYDIKSGSIKIDGTDIREFSLNSLRRNISMVFQDNFLFSGSIKDNILMGNPEARPEELTEAIRAAHLEETIQELPEGLETMLGERGLTLSGGQRQRVAIARALLRNAPIVILDEATSALDNESEAIVQKAMDNLMKNRTVFIIAHRLSTIKNADRIAVINEGKLVELGSHEALMEVENGQYKALYEMQFKKQSEAENSLQNT